jgi:RNA polymerase sigma factor (sigma-70 family)
MQDAMLRAYRAFDSIRGEDVKPWLLTIVRNCFLTVASQRKRKQDVPLPADDEIDVTDSALIVSDPNPEAAIMKKEDARQLKDLLGSLPAEFREVLVLREMEELSYSEIARITGAPIGTVMSRLARARALLRKNWHLSTGGSHHVLQ